VTLTRRARELVIVAMLLALPLLFLRANVKSPSELNFLDKLILRVSAPLQAMVTWAGRSLGAAWSRYVFLVHVKEDNARLTDENARLRTELTRLQREASRGVELEKLVKLRAQVPVESVAAHVIGVEISSFFRVVRIRLDRGDCRVGSGPLLGGCGPDAEPIRPGMPVLSPAGVVGRVQRVFGGYSDVLLATDRNSAIDVVVPRTGGRGVLKGIPGDNRYRTRIEYLLRQDEVAEGDLVVTSGLAGTFPRNLPVGKIVKVSRRDVGLYQEAEVEPVVDFAKLNEVLVVLTPPPEADHSEAPAQR
jgi:rod shape-determining protein MreC